MLPKPGKAPSKETMMGGYWQHRMVGVTEETAGDKPEVVVVVAANDMHR